MTTPTEKELLESLNSDKRNIKLQAIVKLARISKEKSTLDAIMTLLSSNDREISFYANQACTKISQRLGIPFEKPAFNQQIKKLNSKSFRKPNEKDIPILLETIRKNPEQIENNALASAAKFLSQYGDISDSTTLEKYLTQNSSSACLAFIDTAEKIAPSMLKRKLPELLKSQAPLIRSRAIKALYQFEPGEAERHFSDLLSSRNAEDRIAGMGIAFQFPVERVKNYILALLGDEKDKNVITASQVFLASNPDTETAFALLDIIDSAPTPQKNDLTKIFKTICQALASSEQYNKEEVAPEKIVETWKKQRLDTFLSNLEIQLPFAKKARRKAIIDWLTKNQTHPKVTAFIVKLGQDPLTEDVYNIFHGTPKETNKNQVPLNTNSIKPDSSKEKISKMKRLELESFPQNKKWLLEEAKNGKNKVRATALKTLLRLHPDQELKKIAIKSLNSDEVAIKIAALKVLERLDTKYLKGNLENLLEINDPAFRVRIARLALKFNQDLAISRLISMLESEVQSEKTNAISCLALCPFEKISSQLLKLLHKENHPVIARQLIDIILCNPSIELLNELKKIDRSATPAISMVISQGKNDMTELLKEELKKEEEKKKKQISAPTAPSNPTSKNSSKTHIKAPTTPVINKPKTLKETPNKKENNWQLICVGAILFIILGLLPISFLMKPKSPPEIAQAPQSKDWRNNERKKFHPRKIGSEIKMNKICSIKAKLEKFENPKTLIVSSNGRKILVKFEKNIAKSIIDGANIELKLLPYRTTKSGLVVAQGEELIVPERKKQ